MKKLIEYCNFFVPKNEHVYGFTYKVTKSNLVEKLLIEMLCFNFSQKRMNENERRMGKNHFG